MHWDGGWHMGGMWVWWLLLIAGVALVSWLLFSMARKGGSSGDPPEAILKQRYAKGEIDRETYERMLDDLHK